MLAGLFNSVSCVSSDRILIVFDNNIGTRNSGEAQLEIFTKCNVGGTWCLLWNC